MKRRLPKELNKIADVVLAYRTKKKKVKTKNVENRSKPKKVKVP